MRQPASGVYPSGPLITLLIPALAKTGSREANAAAAMEIDGLPRLGFERAVQVEAVLEEPDQVAAPDEPGAQARRVPGRAAREFVLLDEHHVAPAQLRQVIEQAAPRHASADDDDSRFIAHGSRPPESNPTPLGSDDSPQPPQKAWGPPQTLATDAPGATRPGLTQSK
jgi:hypothetical protein